MEREEVLRDDFPTARRGWSPEAVTAHLQEVAAEMARTAAAAAAEPAPAPAAPRETLAEVAAERIHGVIAAAEAVAAEIEAEAQTSADRLLDDASRQSDSMLSGARRESDGLLSGAQAESDRLLQDARAEASGRVERAREAVEGLISQAGELRSRVGMLGEELSESMSSGSASAPRQPVVSEVPGPVIVPEPSPPSIPEPTPDPVPEPTPDPVPEPSPEPTPEPTPDPVPPGPAPTPDLPDAPDPEPPAPEPDPMPAAASSGSSTDDLIAQLRGGAPSEGVNGTSAPAVSGSDLGAARLVAMNMALEGSSRDEIGRQIETEFGSVPDIDALLDEVLARAGR